MRKIVGLKEEFYNRYIVKGNLFKPIVEAFIANGDRYNLLNSAMIELFEFVKAVSFFELSLCFVKLEGEFGTFKSNILKRRTLMASLT